MTQREVVGKKIRLQASQIICQRGVQSHTTTWAYYTSTHHEQALTLRRSDHITNGTRSRWHGLGWRRNVSLQLTHSSRHVTQCRSSSITVSSIAAHSLRRAIMRQWNVAPHSIRRRRKRRTFLLYVDHHTDDLVGGLAIKTIFRSSRRITSICNVIHSQSLSAHSLDLLTINP